MSDRETGVGHGSGGTGRDDARARPAAPLPFDAERAEMLEAVFRASPAFLHVLRGPDFVFEFANDAYYRLVGRRDLIGRPAFEALPEAAAGGYPERIARVMATREPFEGRELPVTLARSPGAPPEERLIDLVYLPLVEPDGTCTRVLGHGTDVTDHVRARRENEDALAAERSELARANRQLRDQRAELELVNAELARSAAGLAAQVEAAEGERARAEDILERMADAYFALDADFRLVGVNASMERSTGLARGELLGRLMWDVFPGTRDNLFERHYRAAMTEGVEAHFTHRYSDGRLDLVTEVDVYPAPGGGAAVFWRDVTARTRTEAALAASEADFRRLFDAIDLAFHRCEVLTDGEGRAVDYRVLAVNPAWGRLTGLDPAAAVGRTAREILDQPESWIQACGRAGLGRETSRVEQEIPALGMWFDVHLVPFGAPESRQFVATAADITPRKRAEAERARLVAELETERERLRSVILDTPAPLALVAGPERRFVLVNEAYRRVSGGGRDVTGLTPREAFPELAGTGLHELFDHVYATGEPWIGPETPVRYDRDGTGVQDTWFDLRYQPVRDAHGAVIGVLNLAVDVTDQVRARRETEGLLAASEAARAEAEEARAEAERERERATAAQREAEAANAAKAQFLANMSHELRTPLNAIAGYVQLLDMGLHGPVTAEQHGALERVQTAQMRLLALINDVLNYAKLESGRVEYDVQPVDVADAVRDVVPLIEPQVRAKRLVLDVRLPDAPCVVWADRDKLGQVLVNLLSNAVKFTESPHPATGEPGVVTIGVATRPGAGAAPSAAGDAVFLEVRDTGRGIPRERQDSIFEPFVQVRARSGSAYAQATEGTGLGLAISRDLARGMGGDLRVRSAPDEGATFTVVLRRVAYATGGSAASAAPDARRTHG